MSAQVIYKSMALGDEATWGTSVNTTRNINIISSSIKTNPNKSLVEDSTVSLKGQDSMISGKIEIDGDIKSYSTPKTLHNFLKYALGGAGATSAVGTSAIQITYNPDISGNLNPFTAVFDRNNTQEAFYGLRASKLALKATDGLIEGTLTVMGKSRGTGVSIADTVGETVKPFVFADAVVTVGLPGFTQTGVLNVSEWDLNYSNGMERTYLSGSRAASRLDAKIPTIDGTLKIIHTGLSYVSPTFGVSELYVRIELTTDSTGGLIAGITPHYLRINIPRVQFATNERNYEAAKISIETITFKGMFDPGTSALVQPLLTTGFDIEN